MPLLPPTERTEAASPRRRPSQHAGAKGVSEASTHRPPPLGLVLDAQNCQGFWAQFIVFAMRRVTAPSTTREHIPCARVALPARRVTI